MSHSYSADLRMRVIAERSGKVCRRPAVATPMLPPSSICLRQRYSILGATPCAGPQPKCFRHQTMASIMRPQLVSGGPTPTTVGDDFNLRHEHMLQAILSPL